MSDTKAWWASKGVMGGVGAVLGSIGSVAVILGAPAAEVAEAQEHVNALVESLPAVFGAVMGLIAIIGRLTATKGLQ